MSGMDGLMALKKIKELDDAIRVVMLTGVEDEDVINEAKRLGACDYITKPCDLEKVEALVLSILIPRKYARGDT
jgi:DNA-binding NtrC family response regulator